MNSVTMLAAHQSNHRRYGFHLAVRICGTPRLYGFAKRGTIEENSRAYQHPNKACAVCRSAFFGGVAA